MGQKAEREGEGQHPLTGNPTDGCERIIDQDFRHRTTFATGSTELAEELGECSVIGDPTRERRFYIDEPAVKTVVF